MFNEIILNADAYQSATADNATATLTLAAVPAQRWFLGGLMADFSAAVVLFKTITVSYTRGGVAKTLVYKWDFTNGMFVTSFPLVVYADYNTAVTVTLTASGTGGTLGQVAAFAALI